MLSVTVLSLCLAACMFPRVYEAKTGHGTGRRDGFSHRYNSCAVRAAFQAPPFSLNACPTPALSLKLFPVHVRCLTLKSTTRLRHCPSHPVKSISHDHPRHVSLRLRRTCISLHAASRRLRKSSHQSDCWRAAAFMPM